MRDFGELDIVPSVGLRVLRGFDDVGQPLVEGTGGQPQIACRSLIVLGPKDIGCELATASIEGSEALLILGRVVPAVPVAEIDGDRLVLSAEKEIVLRCGKSNITLKADGRVYIRGTQILTRADGQNRVQGASVQLN